MAVMLEHPSQWAEQALPLFCHQFLIGPTYASGLRGWRRVQITDQIKLTVHPELNVERVTEGRKTLVLIGTMLDPYAPEDSDRDILRRLFGHFTSVSQLIRQTSRLGGRWVLVAVHGSKQFLFNDALGLRQVFFTNPQSTGDIWVMSQPGMAERLLGLLPSEEAATFIDSYPFRAYAEYRWPGEATAFGELHHLLPNHYLDLARGSRHRYWPREELVPLEPNDARERLGRLLIGLVRAAANRFDLALGLTAGLDSRLAMAAAREVADKIAFTTVRQGRMAPDHPDLTVPGDLLRRLNLEHTVIKASHTMSPMFSRVFKENVFLAQDVYGGDAEAILGRFGRRKVVLTGSGAEVGRCSFRNQLPFSDKRIIDACDLARLQKMPNEPFAQTHFANWLEGLGDTRGINVLDMFEWEQGHGNWLAMTQMQFDIAWQDIITPFNCREVLTTMLAVDEKYRRPPKSVLLRQVIQDLWPQLLEVPINPRTRQHPLDPLRHAKRSLYRSVRLTREWVRCSVPSLRRAP